MKRLSILLFLLAAAGVLLMPKEFIEPVLNTMLEMARRNINGSDVVRVMDDDLGVTQFITITKEDITASGKLRPIGARHYQAKNQLIQNMNGIFNSQIGQMIAPHVSSEKMAALVEELFGFEKYGIIKPNVAIMEQAKTQRLINAAQEQVESGGYDASRATGRSSGIMSPRNYAKEYANYHSSEKAKKQRAENNKANRKAGTYGNGDGKDIAHKDNDTSNNSKSNLTKQSPSKNRSFPRDMKARRK